MPPFAWLDMGLEDERLDLGFDEWSEDELDLALELEEGWLEELEEDWLDEPEEGWLDELEEDLLDELEEGWLEELEDLPEEPDLVLLDDLALPLDEDGLPDELEEEVGSEKLEPDLDRGPSARRGRPQLKGCDTFLPSWFTWFTRPWLDESSSPGLGSGIDTIGTCSPPLTRPMRGLSETSSKTLLPELSSLPRAWNRRRPMAR